MPQKRPVALGAIGNADISGLGVERLDVSDFGGVAGA